MFAHFNKNNLTNNRGSNPLDTSSLIKIIGLMDFPGGPVVKNPPCNAGGMQI